MAAPETSEDSTPDEGGAGSPSSDRVELTSTSDSTGWWSTRAELRSFAELLGLTSVALAQPVLGVFGNDAESFVAARAGTVAIISFALIVVFVPPVALWTVERLVGFVGAAPRRWLHLGFCAVLIAMFLTRLFPTPHGVLVTIVVVAATTGATALVARTSEARQFLGYLALSPVLFVALFLVFSPVRSLAFGHDPVSAKPLHVGELPPIVMIVLDELPLDSLLDGGGNIDADAYPGLSGLAAGATFARNHTTVAPATPVAVPAILTGRVPHDWDPPPTARTHPENLFTLLGNNYKLRAGEYVTQMCPASMCEVPDSNEPERPGPLFMLLPKVPQVFTDTRVFFDLGFEEVDPEVRFNWLTQSLGEQSDRPVVNYLHSILPHQSWERVPGGYVYEATNPPRRRWPGEVTDDEALARLGRQRHLLQVAYADELVARVMDDLHKSGMYDDTLIIITSDHGVSFRPDQPSRPLSRENVNDIAWTPLLIKAPNQTRPRVIDSPTSSIDVLPTIIDLLGLDIDWKLDGHSVFGKPRPEDWSPRILSWKFDELEPAKDGFVHIDGPAGYAEVVKSRALEYGPEWDLRFWRWGDNGDLVGHKTRSLEQTEPKEVTATIDNAEEFRGIKLSDRIQPVYVSGRVDAGGRDAVAVAVNGVIGGWYDTSDVPAEASGRPFAVMIPQSLLRDGDNDIEVFLIDGTGEDRSLIRAGAGH